MTLDESDAFNCGRSSSVRRTWPEEEAYMRLKFGIHAAGRKKKLKVTNRTGGPSVDRTEYSFLDICH